MPQSYHEWIDDELILDHEANPESFRKPFFHIEPNKPKTMNTTEITTEQIKSFLAAKRDECIKIAPRMPVSFTCKCDNFGGDGEPRFVFVAYSSQHGHAAEDSDPSEAVENFRCFVGAYSPKEEAANKRAQAAQLLADAEKLETQAS